jgi:hypothetical protein
MIVVLSLLNTVALQFVNHGCFAICLSLLLFSLLITSFCRTLITFVLMSLITKVFRVYILFLCCFAVSYHKYFPRTYLIYYSLKETVCYDVPPCGSCKIQYFWGMYRFHHQGEKMSYLGTALTVTSNCSNWSWCVVKQTNRLHLMSKNLWS